MLQYLWLAAIVGVTSPVLEQVPSPQAIQERIVVTASLERERPRELPVSVSTLDSEEIRRRQATEVLGLLRTVPGVAVAQSGSRGKVGSVFTRGTQSTHTLVLWNGLRLNDPFFGGFDWAFLPTDGIERVEVVRGPASVVWGSDAIGGVVQLVSEHRDMSSLRAEAGTDAYGRLGVVWGGQAGRVRIDVSGYARTGDGAAENDFYDGEEAMLRLDLPLGGSASVGLLARAGRSEVGIPVASGTATPRRRQESETLQVALPFEARWGRWRLEGSLARVESEFAFRDPDAIFSSSDTDAERLRARSVASYRTESDLWIAFGGDWEREEVTNGSNFGPALTGESRSNAALFAEAQKRWGAVRVDLGVRRDDDEFFGGATSPRAGLVVDLPRGVQVFTSYGEAFRSPSLGELFFPFYGNPDLEPEESASRELGLRRDGTSWRLGLSAFSTDLDNLIDTNPLTFTAVNLGRAEIEGFEAEVGYRRGVVQATAQVTLLSTEDLQSGEELLRRPGESASLVLTLAPEAFTASLTARWVGERTDLDPLTFGRRANPSFSTFDLGVTWQASARLAPFARVENLTGTDYEEVLGFPSPGRTWIGGLEVGIR